MDIIIYTSDRAAVQAGVDEIADAITALGYYVASITVEEG